MLSTMECSKIQQQSGNDASAQLAANEAASNLHYVGLGSSGSNIIGYFSSKINKAQFSYINNNEIVYLSDKARFYAYIPAHQDQYGNCLLFQPEKNNQGLPQQLKQIFQQSQHYILVLGLGGNTGNQLLEEIIDHLQAEGIFYTVLANTPLHFESRHCKYQAQRLMNKYAGDAAFQVIDTQGLLRKIGKQSLSTAYKYVDHYMYKAWNTLLQQQEIC